MCVCGVRERAFARVFWFLCARVCVRLHVRCASARVRVIVIVLYSGVRATMYVRS